jgi:hypothetical protein
VEDKNKVFTGIKNTKGNFVLAEQRNGFAIFVLFAEL